MNRNVAASLLPVVFALVSLGAVACTAEGASSAEVAANDPAAALVPAEHLAGSAGGPTAAASDALAIPGSTETLAGVAAPTARLTVMDKAGGLSGATYEVVDYEFGVENVSPVATATGSLVGSKPALQTVRIAVRPNAKAPALANDVFTQTALDKLLLERVASDGSKVEVATFEHVLISRMSATADGNTTETYELHAAALTVKQGAARVTVDVPANKVTCADPCPCKTGVGEAQLGPYTQASLIGAIAKGSTRVDELHVDLHDLVTPPHDGIPSTSKPVLDGISYSAPLVTSGVCAMYYAGTRATIADVRLGVAAPSLAKAAPVESITWDACFAGVRSVSFAKTDTGTSETVTLIAGGLLRTDRALDSNGLQLGQDAKTGWSFVTNAPALQCSAVLQQN